MCLLLNFLWEKQIGGINGSASPQSMTIDASGNLYTIGRYYGENVDFDPGVDVVNLSNANGNIFIQKLDFHKKFKKEINYNQKSDFS